MIFRRGAAADPDGECPQNVIKVGHDCARDLERRGHGLPDRGLRVDVLDLLGADGADDAAMIVGDGEAVVACGEDEMRQLTDAPTIGSRSVNSEI